MSLKIHVLSLAILLSSSAFASEETSPWLAFPDLAEGQAVWLDNCLGCHGDGTADAPIPLEADAWRERLKQDKAVLYQHALAGFFGPDDAYMPPRGGNPDLTDEQVKAAVDYMTTLAQHHIQATQAKKGN